MKEGFDRAVEFVLDWEGGLVDDPDDPGGVTNFGISQRAHPGLDVRNLTMAEAKEIYRREYWEGCKCGLLPEQVGFVVFDEAVNQGISAAAHDLQTACGVEADGIIGPLTIVEANAKDVRELVVALTRTRVDRYRRTVLARPETKVFLKGWMRRATACLGEALS